MRRARHARSRHHPVRGTRLALRARVHALLDAAHPDTIGSAIHESDHVAGAYDAIDPAAERGRPFDVIHDHSGFTAVAMASRVEVPVVHTLHGPLADETARFYERHARKVDLVAISRSQVEHAPPGVHAAAIVPNPLVVDRWPLVTEKDDYVLWIGRMAAVKGAHRAIEAARLAHPRLIIAGPVQTGQADYFRERIEPHIDGRRVRLRRRGRAGPKQRLFAHAAATLMPIRWQEPFGMVMIEALACGTPVIAFPEGATKEIVIDGDNGLLVADEAEMARAIPLARAIDPHRCRRSVQSRYDIAITADGYEAVYRRAAVLRAPHAVASERRSTLGPVCGRTTRPALRRTGVPDHRPSSRTSQIEH